MSLNDQLEREQEAHESFTAIFGQALKCKELYERAGLTVPERVQWFLSLKNLGSVASPNGASRRDNAASTRISPPARASKPSEAQHEWISIDARDAIVTTLVLAILRSHKEGIPVRQLVELVVQYLPSATPGSVANTGTRLSLDGVINRDDGVWQLSKPEKAAILHDNMLWGPAELFTRPEIAAHRREAILHILKHFPTGLQIVQIVEQLKGCDWMKAPANKDLLKADVKALLDSKKIRQSGNTRKWQLGTKEGHEE